ncbi:MAG: DUF3305 domain-containing protein [Geminicoccaceae bacterium]
MDKLISMPVGIVVERRELDNRWQKVAWKPVGVLPGAAPVDSWNEIMRGDGWIHYHMATLPLELHRKETQPYKTNLNDRPPRLYIVLRDNEDPTSDQDVIPFLVTASPFEAQDYLDAGDEIVEGVTMPEGVIAWVRTFCDHHHVDEPFKKRKRKKHDPNEATFSRRPDQHVGSKERLNGATEPGNGTKSGQP